MKLRHRLQKRFCCVALSVAAAAAMVFVFFTAVSLATVSASAQVTPTDMPGKSSSEETVSLSVEREAPDFLLSNCTVLRKKNGAKFRKFLLSAQYNGNYRSELDENEKKLYDGLYQAFVVDRKSYTESVPVTFDPTIPFDAVYSDAENDILSVKDLGDIDDIVLSAAAAFFYDCPEAFWIRAFSYRIDANLPKDEGKGYVYRIEFIFEKDAYPNAYNDLRAYDEGLASAVNSIRSSRKNESVYETIKAIHDYILLNSSYEYDALSGSTFIYGYAYTAAPLFTGKGKFVCEGYSKAMKILCGKFGINCALVSGDGMTSSSSGGPHMWNYVQIGGKWYAVDATWDDGYANQDGTPRLIYNYFLVGSTTWVRSNKMFSDDHIPDGQVMSVPTKFSMVYPVLSESAYNRYIVDTDPKITLTTLGASIRISEPYGIRFGIQLKRDQALNDVHLVPEFGTLIIPTSTLGDNELTINTPNVRKVKADNIFSMDETQYTYTGVLINIPKSFFGTNIKGRGYLIYVDNDTGEEHIIYSKTVERSFYGVARSAYDEYAAMQNPSEADREIMKKLEAFLDN